MQEAKINRSISDSVIFEIIDIAQYEREMLAKDIKFESQYSEREIVLAVNRVAADDTGIRERIILDDGLSDFSLVRAAKIALRRRRRLSFFIKPLRKFLPKILLKEVPFLGFLVSELKFRC